MITPRHSHGICYFNGTIYVAGLKIIIKIFFIYFQVEILMMIMISAVIVVKNMMRILKNGFKLRQWLIKQLAYL